MTNLTELEAKLLNIIAHCEMNPSNGADPESASDVNTYLWAEDRATAMGISLNAVGGVLSSLSNKGLIEMDAPTVKMSASPAEQRMAGHDPDGRLGFTEAGFEAWKSTQA